MKNVTNKIVLIAFLAFAFLISSCSEDDTVPSDPDNSEVIEQGSELANLMQRTSDGNDNESIDCIDFVYPLNFFTILTMNRPEHKPLIAIQNCLVFYFL